MPNIHIHLLAKTDIQQLWRSSFQQWGEAQTQVYIDQLEHAILTLQDNRHMVFYRVTSKSIFIVRVLHDRMDFTQHI